MAVGRLGVGYETTSTLDAKLDGGLEVTAEMRASAASSGLEVLLSEH